jgi:hypothetical protein
MNCNSSESALEARSKAQRFIKETEVDGPGNHHGTPAEKRD